MEKERKEITVAVPKTILVRALKYDGREHRRWNAQLREHEGPLLVLDGTFSAAVQHDLLGTIAEGTQSLEFYWLDRWYNIFCFRNEAGALRNYYCNINQPPAFDGDVLSYVDLDIDVLVNPDLSYQVVDLEEFDQNAVRYKYPRKLQEQAHAALAELTGLIKTGAFPFTG